MKRSSAVLVLICILAPLSFSAFAQETWKEGGESKKGFALGVDLDEKDYLIASPADNWYFGFNAGIQAFIGNEVVPSARFTGITPALNLEVGKWVLPDLAVSLRLGGYNILGQTRYSLNPFTSFDPTEVMADGYYPYKRINPLMFTLMAGVTLDWTNFVRGYEKGMKRKFHVLTPVTMGAAWVTGKNVNPRRAGLPAPNNFEFCADAGIVGDITLSRNLALSPALHLTVIRGSVDYSSYEDGNGAAIADFLPSFTIGLKVNLMSSSKHKTRYKDVQPVRHVFVPADGSQTVNALNSEIIALKAAGSSMEMQLAEAGIQLNDANTKLAAAEAMIAAQAEDLKKLQDAQGSDVRALNPVEEILAGKTAGNLASAMVYFPLNKATIDLNGERRLTDFADYIKSSPDDAKFYIIGAADKATGTDKINYELSVSRCKAVYNVLVKQCGVNPAKLEMRPLGGIEEYSTNELNRIGIVVLSSDAMTSIVDKYSKKY